MARSAAVARKKKDPAAQARKAEKRKEKKQRQKEQKAASKAEAAEASAGDGGGGGDGASSSSSAQYSSAALLERAEKCLAECELEAAEAFARRALEASPDSEEALAGLGEILVEAGRSEEALKYLLKAVTIAEASKAPDRNWSKYLYLGQMKEGKEAEAFYLKGLNALGTESGEDASSVYCALAELYLTDLCEEDGAKEKCENFCRAAIEAEKENPVAHQTLASFLISAQEVEAAKAALEKSLSLWLPQIKEALGGGEAAEVEIGLAYEKRKEAVKLAIEAESWGSAESVLDTLLAEAEDDLELWYLYGILSLQRPSEGEAANAKSQAKAFFAAVLEMANGKSEEELAEIQALLAHSKELVEGDLADVPMPTAEDEGEANEEPLPTGDEDDQNGHMDES